MNGDSNTRIMVAGIGTGVGKTVVSAILTRLLGGVYWKPVQTGPESESDTATVRTLFANTGEVVHPSTYTFPDQLSPHHAARLANRNIDIESIVPPKAACPLIIEGVGGLLVPLSMTALTIDLFAKWECQWILVSRTYQGSINHTLLSLEAMQRRKIPLLGIIFNGEPNPDSESVILGYTGAAMLGRLLPEPKINSSIIEKYVKAWKPNFTEHLR